MDEILDSPQQQTTEPIYLKRSIRLLRIYVILFFSSIVVLYVRQGKDQELPSTIDYLWNLAVSLGILSMFVMAPLGLFYGFKSKKREEGRPDTRRKYIFIHFLFCLLILLFVGIAVRDIARLF